MVRDLDERSSPSANNIAAPTELATASPVASKPHASQSHSVHLLHPGLVCVPRNAGQVDPASSR